MGLTSPDRGPGGTYTQSVAAEPSAPASPPIRLGGMALRNGIMVHSLDHWAAAVRADDGEIRMASGRKPELPEQALRVPGMRGLMRVAEALYLLPIVRGRLPEARLPFEAPGAMAAMLGAAVTGRIVARRLPPVSAELIGAGISLAPALAALRGSQLARYHGAEHKAIGGYEHGEDAVDIAKEHERCGSHLVGPMLAATVAGNVLLARLRLKPEHRGPARLAVSLGAIGIATETFSWMQRNRTNPLARALARPGSSLQRLAATEEPSAEELEVARAALHEVLRLEGAPAA